jgi:hypothetical protein
MSTQQASSDSVLQATEIVDLTIAQAHEAERNDLVQRLSDARRLLVVTPSTLHVVGEPPRIATDADQTSLRAVTNQVLFALDQLTEMLRFRRSRLVRPGRSAHVRTSARVAEERLDEVRSSSVRWQKLLRDSFATITSDVEFDLRQRMQAVLAEAEETIEHSDPAQNWDEFTGWLRQRATAEAQSVHDLAVTSSRTVSLQVAKHVAPGEMHIIDPPPATIATELPTALTSDKALGSSRVSISSGMNIVFPAYGIFMMFYVLTNVIHLLPLSPAIGLVPAVVVGGLVIIEERKRQLEKRRAQANMTVRSYITDFSMRVTKDSRDLMRQLEQELRDAYGARSEQLQRSLTGTLNVFHRTLAELEQAPSLLEQIDADLAMLSDLRDRASAIRPAELSATS